MKVCDAADWFDASFTDSIRNELLEVPRFHRKQWEFAIIFNELKKSGVLNGNSRGISFGSGKELVLYSIANHVRHIWATDLYSLNTAWACAQTDNLDEFVRADPLIPSATDRISARNMDMRQVEFSEGSFDFAYSSSAVEHIGTWSDFKQHLKEVRRVLKPGGIYVMTTDISYGPTTECPGNYKFNAEGLQWWLQESGMDYEPLLDCRLAQHYINTPLPHDLSVYITPDNGRVNQNLFGLLLQMQQLNGRHPHSSVVLVMKKQETRSPPVEFVGLSQTKEFLLGPGIAWTRMILEDSDLHLHPNPYVPLDRKTDLWGTQYVWLGGKPRTIKVTVEIDRPARMIFGINKAHTDTNWNAVVELPAWVEHVNTVFQFERSLNCHEDWSYSIYGQALDGARIINVDILVKDSRGGVNAANILATPLPPPAEKEASISLVRRLLGRRR